MKENKKIENNKDLIYSGSQLETKEGKKLTIGRMLDQKQGLVEVVVESKDGSKNILNYETKELIRELNSGNIKKISHRPGDVVEMTGDNLNTITKVKDEDNSISKKEIKIKSEDFDAEAYDKEQQKIMDAKTTEIEDVYNKMINEELQEDKEIEKSNQKDNTENKEKKTVVVKKIQKDIEDTFYDEQNKKDNSEINTKLKAIGLNEDYFKDNRDWKDFSKAEKLLIIEQAEQDTLSKVREMGEKRFEEKNSIQRSWNPLKWRASALSKTWHKVGKSFWISKEEKEVLREVEEGKMKPDEKVLNALVERQSDLGLSVIEKDGKAFIEFAKGDENLSKEDKILVDRFNRVANNFSQVPDSWRNEKSAKSTDKMFTDENYKKFDGMKKEYENEKALFIQSKVRQYETSGMNKKEAKEKAMLDIKDVDYIVSILQFTNTNPDAMEELNKIRNESSWGRLVNNENIWRAGYIGAGYAARTAFTATVGWLTAPITAGVIGGIRGRRKANEDINKSFNEGRKEETFLERRGAGKKGLFDNKNKDQNALSYVLQGEKVNTKEVAAFVDADSQKQRIDNLVNKINSTEDDREKLKLMSQLEARLHYIELKQNQGLVNYGTENPIAKNYELFKVMSEAYVVSTTIDNLSIPLTKEMNEDLRERDALLANIMAKNEASFGEKIASHKNAEMLRGAMVGAGFATLGGLIREWVQGGETEHVIEIAKGEPIIKPVEEVIKHLKVEAVADNGQGAISTLRELQNNLKIEYPDLSKAPESVKHILNTDAHKLAQEYGMYKPGEGEESAFLKVGDKLSVDESGNVKFGDTLLEEGNEIKADHTYEGKMFDADHSQNPQSFEAPEQINPVIDKPLHEIIENEQINPEDANNLKVQEQVNPTTGEQLNETINDGEINPEKEIVTNEEGNISKPFNYTRGINEAVKLNSETASVYDKNIGHLFPGKNIKVWGDAKNLSVEKLMQLAKKKELNEVYMPLFAHIKKLEQITKLNPEYSNQIRPSETIQSYIARAMKKAEELGKIKKVTLVRDSEVFKVKKVV